MDTVDSGRTARSVVSNREPYDLLAKIIIVGSSATGKTCVLQRLLKGDEDGDGDINNMTSAQTIGVEFCSRVVTAAVSGSGGGGGGGGEAKVKLQLWDTAGQERFRSLTRSYYRGSAGVVLVFDLSNRRTLNDLRDFWADALALTKEPTVVLVGNKLDLVDEMDPSEVVQDEEVAQFIKRCCNGGDNKVRYVKVSALTGQNVASVFEQLAGDIVDKVELGVVDPEDQSHGVQYGDTVLGWDQSYSTMNSTTTMISPAGRGRILRRKATTLSLVERSVQDNQCSC